MTRTMVLGAAAIAALALAGCQKGGGQESSASAESAAPASATPASAQVQPALTPGVVSASTPTSLTITVQGAPQTFQLTSSTTIMVTHKGSLADIKAGDFLGTTNRGAAGATGQSTEVHIFPPGVRMGEGDRPMAPPPGTAGGGATRMTNGTVSAASPAGGTRMTNGAAGNVSTSSQGVQMDVAYQGGTRHIVVPPGTPVMVMGSGAPAMLKPGAKVLVGHVPSTGGGPDTATFINLQ